ncbi:hypothetical protein DENSPDRAFT_707334 [Dentipellis sp. KUC8613]|nr:hypothetical protein DENSPDRAFT_707334 [Dentipellis sp. KUC8613]
MRPSASVCGARTPDQGSPLAGKLNKLLWTSSVLIRRCSMSRRGRTRRVSLGGVDLPDWHGRQPQRQVHLCEPGSGGRRILMGFRLPARSIRLPVKSISTPMPFSPRPSRVYCLAGFSSEPGRIFLVYCRLDTSLTSWSVVAFPRLSPSHHFQARAVRLRCRCRCRCRWCSALLDFPV